MMASRAASIWARVGPLVCTMPRNLFASSLAPRLACWTILYAYTRLYAYRIGLLYAYKRKLAEPENIAARALAKLIGQRPQFFSVCVAQPRHPAPARKSSCRSVRQQRIEQDQPNDEACGTNNPGFFALVHLVSDVGQRQQLIIRQVVVDATWPWSAR